MLKPGRPRHTAGQEPEVTFAQTARLGPGTRPWDATSQAPLLRGFLLLVAKEILGVSGALSQKHGCERHFLPRHVSPGLLFPPGHRSLANCMNQGISVCPPSPTPPHGCRRASCHRSRACVVSHICLHSHRGVFPVPEHKLLARGPQNAAEFSDVTPPAPAGPAAQPPPLQEGLRPAGRPRPCSLEAAAASRGPAGQELEPLLISRVPALPSSNYLPWWAVSTCSLSE